MNLILATLTALAAASTDTLTAKLPAVDAPNPAHAGADLALKPAPTEAPAQATDAKPLGEAAPAPWAKPAATIKL